MTNFQKFSAIYAEELPKAVAANPDDYMFPIEKCAEVVGKMMAAVKVGSYSKDGAAFKATCKRLGIKLTYRDINAFVAG